MKTLKTKNRGLIRIGLCSTTRGFVLFAILILMTFIAQATTFVPVFSNAWNLVAGTIPGLPANAGNNCRGIGIDPVDNDVLYFSSTGGTNNGNSHVGVLSPSTGALSLELNSTGISGGTVGTEGVRVADDGSVYGCNLSGGAASTFHIYRWPSDTDVVTAPTIVASVSGPSFTERVGDYMDLRGSGINTEIVAVGNGSGVAITTNFVIFRPTDSTCTAFTNFSIFIPGSSASICLCGAGVAFEGTNNVIWIRQAGSQNTRRIVYDPTTLTATCNRTNTVDQSVCQGLKYYTNNGVQLLATVQPNTALGAIQIARVFQVPTSPTAPFVSVLASNLPVVGTSQNGNPLGNVDIRNGNFVFGAPGNGVSLFSIGFITNSPPAASVTSSGSPIIAGYPVTFTAAASGSTPLIYQWYFNTNTLIGGATTNFYTLASVQTTNAGVYTLIVTNLYGAVTNSVTIAVLPNGASALMTNLWSLAPGSRTYLTTGDTQRGLGYDTNLNRLVLVSRSTTNGVHLLNASTGADEGEMDIAALLTITPPGALAVNMCGVADDGAVYVANLTTSASAASSDAFVIYRWASADTSATMGQAYAGNPGSDAGWTGAIGRIGDTMAVRGAGVNTEILCTFRNGTNICIFTTTDGVTFTPNIIAITNLVASIGGTDPFTSPSPLGLGCAFGPGNTFWAKSTSYNLRQVSFDLSSSMGAVIGSYPLPASEAPLGIDNANGYAAVIGVTETPQNLAIYDLFAAGGPSLNSLSDREFYPVSNANGNGTGAVAVDVNGGRMFALDSNSGIIALTYAGRPFITANGASQQVVAWATSASTLQSTTNLAVPFVDVLGATSPYTNTTDNVKFFRLKK